MSAPLIEFSDIKALFLFLQETVKGQHFDCLQTRIISACITPPLPWLKSQPE